jgi:hypothetical protein
MDPKAVEVMCRVAHNLVTIKGMVCRDNEIYRAVREQIGDCLEIMALYCDAAPVKLMSGQSEEIMENHDYMKNLPEMV